MLSSISPLGERARASSWRATTTAYLVGSAISGTAMGALLGGAGRLLGGRPAAFVAILLAVGLAVLLALELRGRLPSWRRQVDVGWIGRYRGWVTGVGYGTQLGLGVVTIITSSSTYAALALALLSGSPGRGAAIGLVFGFVRAVPSLLMRRVDTQPGLHRVFERLRAWRLPADRIAMVATSAVIVGLGVAAWVTLLGGWSRS